MLIFIFWRIDSLIEEASDYKASGLVIFLTLAIFYTILFGDILKLTCFCTWRAFVNAASFSGDSAAPTIKLSEPLLPIILGNGEPDGYYYWGSNGANDV